MDKHFLRLYTKMNYPLDVVGLRKTYSGLKNEECVVVNDISFNLKEGEILGLLGPNGSGKTTTIQMLLGTLTPTKGSIYYFGENFFNKRTKILEYLTFASTYTKLPSNLTIAQNLEIFGCFYGLSTKESAKNYIPLLERFGIYDKLHKPVGTLSAGQITRLMLVKAFFIEPKIVLLDEPTASLDPDIAAEVCSFVLEMRNRMNISVLFTSHKMDEVMRICDRSIFLKSGKIIANDVPKKLASTVLTHRLKLVISKGLEQLTSYINHAAFPHSVNHSTVEITLDEQDIPGFLKMLSQMDIIYTSINIEEPSLEEYFKKISKN